MTNLKHRLAFARSTGAIAQMGERLICIQEVGGSIPPGSTIVVLNERRGCKVKVFQESLESSFLRKGATEAAQEAL